MSAYVPFIPSAIEGAVTGTASTLTSSMDTTQPNGFAIYSYVSNVDTWICQGSAPTATAGAGSAFIPAATPTLIDGYSGAALSILADSSSGRASLVSVIGVR